MFVICAEKKASLLPGESQGREAWLAAVYGVAWSQTRLKRRSSSSSSGQKGI